LPDAADDPHADTTKTRTRLRAEAVRGDHCILAADSDPAIAVAWATGVIAITIAATVLRDT
jgi:hypothetical protein